MPRAASSTARRIHALSIGETFVTDGSLVVMDAPGAMTTGVHDPDPRVARSLRAASSGRRSVPADRVRLPSGLSPSVLEFHQVNRPRNSLGRVADYHRRLGITPTPEHASGFTRASSVPLSGNLTTTQVTSWYAGERTPPRSAPGTGRIRRAK